LTGHNSARLRYHFEPQKGWLNDPNGLVWYRGQYHAFFQHNPYAAQWGSMHWGHAVSNDLIHWTELPLALTPSKRYDKRGCYSGSAVEKDGSLWLFYTGVDMFGRQTQCLAISNDGVTFTKHAGNPIVKAPRDTSAKDFRDPKVTKFGNAYHMVVGGGKGRVGKVLHYRSTDLLCWDYVGVLLAGRAYGKVIECPDLFPLSSGCCLIFSVMNTAPGTPATRFFFGEFDGDTFTVRNHHSPARGPDFYAPQTFMDGKGRQILLAWFSNWKRAAPKGALYAGAFTIPMEIRYTDGKLTLYPVDEVRPLLTQTDPAVTATANRMLPPNGLCYDGDIDRIDVLRDGKAAEVFINGGEAAFFWRG
jgi:beta-fructofuranosidase